MSEFVDRIIELQQAAIKVPPYCFTNTELEKEKQLAVKMKDPQFYRKLYDTLSDEYEMYNRYRQFYSTLGTSLLVFLFVSRGYFR